MSEFIADQIEVECDTPPYPPTAFTWRGVRYRITEIQGSQRRLDFRRPWYRRRHRDHYWVKTDTGEKFELYFHRGPGKKYWVLYRKL